MYWIKTYGAKHCDFRFHRYPSVIERARKAIADPDVAGYLLCALERPPKITGLLFFDPAKSTRRDFPFMLCQSSIGVGEQATTFSR